MIAQTLDVLQALSDPTRLRLLAVLDGEELTVQELQRSLSLPQSRVSTHLGRLRDSGLVVDRVDGPHRFYRLVESAMNESSRATWQALKTSLAADPQIARDRQQREEVTAERSGASWIDRVAGSLDRHYSPGRTWEALGRGLALLSPLGVVVDLGAGDGAIAELLSPRAEKIYCVDKSARMIDAGRRRLRAAGARNVELLEGDMHDVPLPDACGDLVLLLSSLQYAREPKRVFSEVHRLLRPGGKGLVITLDHHTHEEVRTLYGHVHLGFRPAQLRRWIEQTGLLLRHLGPAGKERRPPQFEAQVAIVERPLTSTRGGRNPA